MLCNIKPVPFHESDKHIFAKIPGGVRTPGFPPPLDPPMGTSDTIALTHRYTKLVNFDQTNKLWDKLVS